MEKVSLHSFSHFFELSLARFQRRKQRREIEQARKKAHQQLVLIVYEIVHVYDVLCDLFSKEGRDGGER